MSEIYNVYCDESCHLEHDRQPVMVLGAVWCPLENVRESAKRIREIKAQHGIPSDFEIKWVKVSPARLDFYKDVMPELAGKEVRVICKVIPSKVRVGG